MLFFIGLAGVAVSAFYLLDHWPWLVLSACITFLYSAPKIPHRIFRSLRKVALAKTVFLAFVWMYVTTVLPLEISEQGWRTDFTLFALSRFFLIYAICILFDYRDRDHDRQVGIRSLITWLSFKNITRLYIASLLLFFVFTLLMLSYGYPVVIVLILLLPGVISALLYRHASRNFPDMLYYFVLDGLMALSSIMTLFIQSKP
jgi:1,4-dihydroxy-2-naphthoate octaprenyltransferase